MQNPIVTIETTQGTMKVELYPEVAPNTVNNFIYLVKRGFYDGTIFHRVIPGFMVQGGDPEGSGMGGPGYTVKAEINARLFHKRGALCAARLGDEVNPGRESSGSQFYIVWGSIYKPAQLKQMEKQMQQNQVTIAFNDLVAAHKDEIMEMRRNRDRAGLQDLQERLIQEAQDSCKANPVGFTEEQTEAYSTLGGTPHLDGQYTVFGEVTEGMDVVEKIQAVERDANDRPLTDVRIVRATITRDVPGMEPRPKATPKRTKRTARRR